MSVFKIPDPNAVRIFAGKQFLDITRKICCHLPLDVARSSTEYFPDGETIVKINDDVRGRDCYVVLSTCSPVNENLMEALVFADALKRASARQIVLVAPYFGYARQDRKNEGRTPITAKLVANLLTEAGYNRLISMDLHASQIEGFFDIPVDHLSATPLFIRHFEENREVLGDLCIVSPDVGNLKVAEKIAGILKADLAIIHKTRIDGSTTHAKRLIGDVSGKTVIMFDDMIVTASTQSKAAALVSEKGASRIISAAVHGLLIPPSVENINSSQINSVIVSNSIPRSNRTAGLGERLIELDIAELLAEAISRVHNNESVSAMFKKTAGSKR